MIASFSALDNRILWDIGIHRSEIEDIIDGIVSASLSNTTIKRSQEPNFAGRHVLRSSGD